MKENGRYICPACENYADAKRGIRALWNDNLLREWAEQLSGRDLEAGKGTLPWTILTTFSRFRLRPGLNETKNRV